MFGIFHPGMARMAFLVRPCRQQWNVTLGYKKSIDWLGTLERVL
jgi:hypothetical protein